MNDKNAKIEDSLKEYLLLIQDLMKDYESPLPKTNCRVYELYKYLTSHSDKELFEEYRKQHNRMSEKAAKNQFEHFKELLKLLPKDKKGSSLTPEDFRNAFPDTCFNFGDMRHYIDDEFKDDIGSSRRIPMNLMFFYKWRLKKEDMEKTATEIKQIIKVKIYMSF